MKPYSEACERNRDPIFTTIQPLLAERRAVLEIGSGTGQHAVYFAAKLPHLIWHTSDRQMYHAGIQLWLNEAAAENIRAPLVLDVTQAVWPAVAVDAVYSANTAHIMHWPEVAAMFAGVGRLLPAGGFFAVRPVQLPQPLHQRQQPAVRCATQIPRSPQRHPRCRSTRPPGRTGANAGIRRCGHAGQ